MQEPIRKISKERSSGGMAKTVVHLLSKREALRSNPSMAKKRQEKEKLQRRFKF
jgi:hypothetical protein